MPTCLGPMIIITFPFPNRLINFSLSSLVIIAFKFAIKSEVEQLEVLTPWLNLKNQGKKDELKVEQPVQKQRPSTIDKIECQKKAKELWDNAKQNGVRILGTGEMANHPDIKKIGGNYRKEQRQRWISEIAPPEAKKPGVRPQKN